MSNSWIRNDSRDAGFTCPSLGVVREGALADLLLVNGDPTVDIGLVARPEQSFAVIMKDGIIYKNRSEPAQGR